MKLKLEIVSNFSAWHRVPHDEIFHFYQGASVEFFMISMDGHLRLRQFGGNFNAGEEPQIVVPGGTWQALRIKQEHSSATKTDSSENLWVLMGTTMSLGFQDETFELGSRERLIRQFPLQRDIIEALTRE